MSQVLINQCHANDLKKNQNLFKFRSTERLE